MSRPNVTNVSKRQTVSSVKVFGKNAAFKMELY